MADPYVRHIGTVEDFDGRKLDVGVDAGTVTVNAYRFGRTGFEELSHLLVCAEWEAAADSEKMRAEAPECPHVWGYVGIIDAAGVEVYRCETCQALHATTAIT